MDIARVIAHLKANCPELGRRVFGAAEHERAVDNGYPGAVPAAYVVPLADEPGENKNLTGLWQEVQESVAVVLVLDNTADRRGSAAAISVEALKYAVHRALLNWRADPERAPRGLQYETGHLVAVEGARLVWQLAYSHAAVISDADGWQEPGEPLLHIDGHRAPGGAWSFDTTLPQDTGGA